MDDTQLDECMNLIADCRWRLARFVRVLVPSDDDAEEIVQMTMVTIWEKVDQFDLSDGANSFFAWACRIAVNHARNYVRRTARCKMLFSTEAIEKLAMHWDSAGGVLDQRRAALKQCLNELPAVDRELVDRCYAPGSATAEVAERLGRQPTSVFRSLRRIRHVLQRCIDRKVAEVGG